MNAKEIICRLCLKIPDIDPVAIDDAARQIFDVLQIRLDFKVNENPVMCKDCSQITGRLFALKSLCVNAEEIILLYYSLHENSSCVHLRDIYEGNVELTLGEDDDICRLCMKPKEGVDLTSVDVLRSDEEFIDMWTKYMTEVNLNLTKNPKFCSRCKTDVLCYFKFISDVQAIEEKINSYRESLKGDKRIELSDVLKHINSNVLECSETPIQTFTVKTEDVTESLETNNFHELSDIKVDLEEKDEEGHLSENLPGCSGDQNDNLIKEEVDDGTLKIEDELEIEETKILVADQSENCQGASPETDLKLQFKKKRLFVILPRIPTERKKYKCNVCGFETHKKQNLEHHMIKHEDKSPLKLYECRQCSYQTYWRGTLKYHLQQHSTETYTCEYCIYSTTNKQSIKRHMEVHDNMIDPKPVVLHKCANCDYQCRSKRTLKDHITYNHKDPSELQMHKCRYCNYESYKKTNVRVHMWRHEKRLKYTCTTTGSTQPEHFEKPTEVEMHECNICGFTSKHRNSLQGHMLKHTDSRLEKQFKCSACNYETNRKYSFIRHRLVHKDDSEIRMYNCLHCGFRTRHRSSFISHVAKHRKVMERYGEQVKKEELLQTE